MTNQIDRIQQIKNNSASATRWWIALTVVGAILSVLITWGCAAKYELGSGPAIAILFAALIILAGITILKGWTIVPENHIMVVELNGKYMASWKSGLHIAFPFFGIMRRRATIDMGEIRRKLFLNPEEKIDFHDTSAPISAGIHFKVVDEVKAVYAIDNFITSTCNRLEGATRATCGLYNLDEANMDKHLLDLPAVIIHCEEVSKLMVDGKIAKQLNDEERLDLINKIRQFLSQNPEIYKERPLYKDLLEDWGIEVTKLTVSDIDIPLHIQKARELKLTAAEEFEAQAIKNQNLVETSKAEATAYTNKVTAEAGGVKLKGKALADQIKSLVDDGKIEPKEAAEMIVNIKKWESLGDKTVVLESGMPDSMLKRFVELGILAQTGSNIAKP